MVSERDISESPFEDQGFQKQQLCSEEAESRPTRLNAAQECNVSIVERQVLTDKISGKERDGQRRSSEGERS